MTAFYPLRDIYSNTETMEKLLQSKIGHFFVVQYLIWPYNAEPLKIFWINDMRIRSELIAITADIRSAASCWTGGSKIQIGATQTTIAQIAQKINEEKSLKARIAKVTLAACSVILLLGTAYYFLTGCNEYYCRPKPPCEPSFCELHQYERILGGSCYCPDWPNS